MDEAKYVEIFRRQAKTFTAKVEEIVRLELPQISEQALGSLLQMAQRIAILYPQLAQTELNIATKRKLHDIIQDEYVNGLTLQQTIAASIALRDAAFDLVLNELKDSFGDRGELLNFLEWRNRVSRNLSLNVVAFYESVYFKNLAKLDDNYKNLLNRMHDLVLVVTEAGGLEYFNEKVVGFTGYSRKQLAKMNYRDFLHPGDHADFQQLFKQNTKQGTYLDLRIITHTGQTKSLSFFVLKTKQRWGKTVLECIGNDLSNDRLLETKLEDRYHKMQEAYVELGRVNRQLSFLTDLCGLFSKFNSDEERLEYILYVIAQILQADTVVFRELDNPGKRLVFRYAYKLEKEWAEIMFGKDQKHVSWQAILQGTKIYVPDVSRDQEHTYYGLVKRYNFKSVLACPVILAGKCWGVINAFAVARDAFGEYPDEVLEAIINQFALLFYLQKQGKENHAKT